MNAEAFKRLAQECSDEIIAETEKRVESHLELSHFIDGQRDCRDKGKPEIGRNPEYYRGYGVEYALEQQRTGRSRENEPV